MYIMGCSSSSSSLNAGFPLQVKPAAYILLWGHLTLQLTSTVVQMWYSLGVISFGILTNMPMTNHPYRLIGVYQISVCLLTEGCSQEFRQPWQIVILP